MRLRLSSRLLDLAMAHPRLAPLRARALADAAGLVLEIGAGTGRNLPYFGPSVAHLLASEPNLDHLLLARGRSARAPVPVSFFVASAEALPLPDRSVDAVVSTFCLCSIPEVGRALAEIRRVLAPGAPYLFLEHGLCPDPDVASWQRRLAPWWRRLAGGCRLDRPIAELVRAAGFAIERLETGKLLPGPRLLAWTYLGRARAGEA
ncbi:MAG: class I SAM-dependent methyltransferase [Geminicoccaceae bacterium]|nr:class I SAM-dependent methyltransferase [Geminicoccaceae bacterium]MCS7266763.1 class I SAM-dependent methyltransferase [Geminicoccaceae bacterium]MCX7628680.1 class I SAM-dependent methyltransferase [Geminicoccaceae bacterium]MDW8123784.1 class I SAM-dependent methyltransferase [Geminicoccaceae bacterium]MDW8341618.1 class I SAM-dependent methyltransferase [Geminicoccaceae bacterium]